MDEEQIKVDDHRQEFERDLIERGRKSYCSQRTVNLRRYSLGAFWFFFLVFMAFGNVHADLIIMALFASAWGLIDVSASWWREDGAYVMGMGTLKTFGGFSVLSGTLILAAGSYPRLGLLCLLSGGFVVLMTLLIRELQVGVIVNQLVGYSSRRALLRCAYRLSRAADDVKNDFNYAKIHVELFIRERFEVVYSKVEILASQAKDTWLSASSPENRSRAARLLRNPKLKTYP